jgi:transposase
VFQTRLPGCISRSPEEVPTLIRGEQIADVAEGLDEMVESSRFDAAEMGSEAADLPIEARMPLDLLVGQFTDTKARIDAVAADLRRAAEANAAARRLQTMPGICPITASILAATLPDVSGSRSARAICRPGWA